MSLQPTTDPDCEQRPSEDAVTQIIDGRARNVDGLSVRRILPSARRRLVGPFIFFDHMGPAELPRGRGIDVRPHPHINLATLTYLFEGEIVHRDSLGSRQPIRPGAVNWMTAGRGIVHSERSSPEERARGPRLHGIQLWLALPTAHEEDDPEFCHYPGEALPAVEVGGARLRVLAGTAYGVTSPVRTLSRLLYCEAVMPAGSEIALSADHRERAAYVVEGQVACAAEQAAVGRMLVFQECARALLRAETDSRVMLLGGAPLDGPRHIFWNFVSSRPERIEAAKRGWREGRFPTVPGDEKEYVPLPE